MKQANSEEKLCSTCFSESSDAAVEELRAFAEAKSPAWLTRHPTIGGAIYVWHTMWRPMIHLMPRRLVTCTLGTFWGEHARIGGIASINVLLMAAEANDNVARFEKQSTEYLSETNSMFNSVAVYPRRASNPAR